MCVLMCGCPPCPFSHLFPVLAKLQQADLITNKECSEANEKGGKGLTCVGDVVRFQSSKSCDVMTKTAEVLRSRGFERESEFLLGKQMYRAPSFYMCSMQILKCPPRGSVV